MFLSYTYLGYNIWPLHTYNIIDSEFEKTIDVPSIVSKEAVDALFEMYGDRADSNFVLFLIYSSESNKREIDRTIEKYRPYCNQIDEYRNSIEKYMVLL